MTDINKALETILDEYRNASFSPKPFEPDYDKWVELSEEVGKKKKAEAIAKIKALVVESMPKNEPHRKDCPANGFTCVCEMWKQNRNQCLGEIRSIWG